MKLQINFALSEVSIIKSYFFLTLFKSYLVFYNKFDNLKIKKINLKFKYDLKMIDNFYQNLNQTFINRII